MSKRLAAFPFPLLVVTLALSTSSLARSQAVRLLGVQSLQSTGGPASLIEIDAGTGVAILVGVIGGQMDSLASAPSGILYGVNSSSKELVSLDAQTGAVSSIIGSFGSIAFEGLAAHPFTGELWGLAFPGSELVRVNSQTAAVTTVGVLLIAGVAGLTWSADGTTLYAVGWSDGGLFVVDPMTAAVTLIGNGGPAGSGGPLGLAAHPVTGDLYVAEWWGGVNDSILSIVSRVDGSRTTVGPMIGWSSVEGLTFTPDMTVANFCGPAVPNSSGMDASIAALGSASLVQNNMALTANGLPMNSFGFFLASNSPGFVMNPAGSAGNLCLGGAIGRYVGPGQIQNSGQAGTIQVALDLSQVPTPTGSVAMQPGDNWNFQAWFRDAVGGQVTSNFTDGLSVTFY